MQEITHEQLKSLLKDGPLRFNFIKTNGELREAYGTTNLSRIPQSAHPKGGDGPKGATCYFDLDKNAWRSIGGNQTVSLNE